MLKIISAIAVLFLLFICTCAMAADAARLSVPYYRQGDRNWCGPTSLSMALKYLGVDVEMWRIAAGEGKVSMSCAGVLDLRTCYESGASMAQLHARFVKSRLAHKYGLEVRTKDFFGNAPTSDAEKWIRDTIDRGYPVMVMSVSRLHWIVITGYDARGVTYHDPSGQFNPKYGTRLVNARISWAGFFATLETVGGRMFQLMAVQRKSGDAPAGHRNLPRPTIQIMPDLWLDTPRAGHDFPTCSQCLFTSADGRTRIAFTFPRSVAEGKQYRDTGVVLRLESGAREADPAHGRVIHSSDVMHLKYSLYQQQAGQRYVVRLILYGPDGKRIPYVSPADGKKYSARKNTFHPQDDIDIANHVFKSTGDDSGGVRLSEYLFPAAEQVVKVRLTLSSGPPENETLHDSLSFSMTVKTAD